MLSRRILRGSNLIIEGNGSNPLGGAQPPLVSMMVVLAFGWIFSLFWFAFGGSVSDFAHLKGDGLWAILFLGIACSGLAYIFWYQALSVIDATQAGVFLYFEPIVTVLLAWPILGEKMSLGGIIGGMGILLRVWAVNRGWN